LEPSLSVKTALKAVFAPAVVDRLGEKLHEAEFAARHAREALSNALIESEGVETPAVQKARAEFSTAERHRSDLEAAFAEARRRKAAQEAAEEAERRDKEARAHAAKRDAAIKRATKAAEDADKLVVALAAAVREAVEAERELAPYFDSEEFAGQFSTVLQALPLCVQYHLKFLGTFTGVGAGFDEAQARWARYFPHTILALRS